MFCAQLGVQFLFVLLIPRSLISSWIVYEMYTSPPPLSFYLVRVLAQILPIFHLDSHHILSWTPQLWSLLSNDNKNKIFFVFVKGNLSDTSQHSPVALLTQFQILCPQTILLLHVKCIACLLCARLCAKHVT